MVLETSFIPSHFIPSHLYHLLWGSPRLFVLLFLGPQFPSPAVPKVASSVQKNGDAGAGRQVGGGRA